MQVVVSCSYVYPLIDNKVYQFEARFACYRENFINAHYSTGNLCLATIMMLLVNYYVTVLVYKYVSNLDDCLRVLIDISSTLTKR